MTTTGHYHAPIKNNNAPIKCVTCTLFANKLKQLIWDTQVVFVALLING